MSDFRLDEATKKALIGLMPFSQDGTMEFTPDAFKIAEIPEEARPIYELRAFTKQEFQAVRDIYSKDSIKDKQKALWKVGCRAVMGWKNVFDLATGEPVPFEFSPDGGVKEDLWEAQPLMIRREIFTQISVMSGLLAQERQGLKS